jgi:hypothetical protein
MLWQKAWIESRGRFLFGVAATGTACAYSWYANRYQGIPRTTFIVFCFLFGMGGLLREHAVGTAPFTLALPVSRLRLVATRAGVGWIELVALAMLASLFTASPLQSWLLWGGRRIGALRRRVSCVVRAGGRVHAICRLVDRVFRTHDDDAVRAADTSGASAVPLYAAGNHEPPATVSDAADRRGAHGRVVRVPRDRRARHEAARLLTVVRPKPDTTYALIEGDAPQQVEVRQHLARAEHDRR